MSNSRPVTPPEAVTAPDAPGAVPPTGGTPPEDASPSGDMHERQRSAADDLVDGIDLLLRAARKTLDAVDPRLEAAAAVALERLREIDETVTAEARKKLGADAQQLESIAKELGRELSDAVQRVASRVDRAFRKRP
jgi:hypothetical protein